MSRKPQALSPSSDSSPEWLELHLLENRILLYLRRGKDITLELENRLRELGVRLTCDFKSPCG